MTTNVLKKGWFNPISISVLLILIAISICLYLLQIVNVALFVLLLIIAVLLASSIRIADQWERAVVLRMGKFCGLKGPGPFMIVPILDSVSTYIDQRVRVSAFKAEQTLILFNLSQISVFLIIATLIARNVHFLIEACLARNTVNHR